MRALVFGQSGQVATELARQVPGPFEAVFLSRADADLSRPDTCGAAINAHKPDVVINAAAYTAVDRAEDEEPLATLINGDAPAAMARAAAGLGIPLVHVSTDYVFDGSGDVPWAEDAPTGPLGAYGRSKLAGEQAIEAAGGAYAILRTSWVFSAYGGNFVKTMLRLSETRDRLTIVADQIGGPTPAADIAEALWTMAGKLVTDPGPSGIYHFAGAPAVSWADFAREIFAQTGRAVTVDDIPTSGYPTPARRPANSRLDCTRIARDFAVPQPDWRRGLSHVLQEVLEPSR